MTRLSHLNAMQALEATLRHGSMRLAAEELGITPAALGQRIKCLEEYLGYPLVQRTRNGITASPATAEVQEELHTGFHQLAKVAQGLRFDRPNTITLLADKHWHECWLLPRLRRFTEELPELSLDVTTQADSQAPSDLTIQFTSPSPNCKLLFQEYIAPVVTPAMHHRLHQREDINILESQPLLHLDIYQSDDEALTWPQWFHQFGYRTKGYDRGIRHTSARNAIEATTSNSGTLLAGLALCLDKMERDELCLLFASHMGKWTQQGYCLAWHDKPRSQVERFIRWLEEEAQATRSQLESITKGTESRKHPGRFKTQLTSRNNNSS